MPNSARNSSAALHVVGPRIGQSNFSLEFVDVLLMVALTMRLASTETANFSYFILAGCALLGRAAVVKALALTWLFIMINPGIAPESNDASVMRYVVLMSAAVSVAMRSGSVNEIFNMNSTMLATLALGAFLVVHSTLVSPMPDVSILKAVAWTVATMVMLSAWSSLNDQERARLERQLFGGLTVLVVISLPFAFTNVGYLVNGTGFQGVMNHPQAFGLVTAYLGAWAAGRLLETAQIRLGFLALLVLCVALVIMSEARTAGGGLVLGVVTASLSSSWLTGIALRKLMPALKSGWLLGLITVMVFGLLIEAPLIRVTFDTYLTKREDTGAIEELIERSRGDAIDAMMDNVRQNLGTGIGFGIASDYGSMEVNRDNALGLPTDAVVEKGVMPIAVLEELGAFGFLLVCAWLWMLVRRGARSGVAELSVLGTLLYMNLGESILFSAGGMGMMALILLAWSVTGRRYLMQPRVRL